MQVRVKSHEVVAKKIAVLRPYRRGQEIAAGPDQCLVLGLEGGDEFKWLVENQVYPQPGWYLIHDTQTKTHYVVDEAQFTSLFEQA
jgi:hypothetical protein